ncbi:hypothetical protein D3C73_1430080 [compost metagenome]
MPILLASIAAAAFTSALTIAPDVIVAVPAPAAIVISPEIAGSRAAGRVPLVRSPADRVGKSASDAPVLLSLLQAMAAAAFTSASAMTRGAIAVTPSPVLVTSPV